MTAIQLTYSTHRIVDKTGTKTGDKYTLYIECGGVQFHTFALFGNEYHTKKTIERIESAIRNGNVKVKKK